MTIQSPRADRSTRGELAVHDSQVVCDVIDPETGSIHVESIRAGIIKTAQASTNATKIAAKKFAPRRSFHLD